MEENQKIGRIIVHTNIDYLVQTYTPTNKQIYTYIANAIFDKHPSKRIWVKSKDNNFIPISVEFSPNNYDHLEKEGNIYWNIIGPFDKESYTTSIQVNSFMSNIEAFMLDCSDLLNDVLPQFHLENFQEPIKIFSIKKDTLLDDDFVD